MNRGVWPKLGVYLMNFACNKQWTQDDITKITGTGASIIGIVFGFIYGFCSFSKFDKLIFENPHIDMYIEYLRGNWTFRGNRLNIRNYFILYCSVGILFLGVMFIFQFDSFRA